jgi:uncharacterized protein (TIGR02596 family)
VELLVVMAIIGILVAVTVPAMTSLFEGDGLNSGAQQVADQINLARQLSSAKNVTVELRVFKLAGATTSGYTALQMGTNTPLTNATSTNTSANTAPVWTAVSRLSFLPRNIVISENTNVSAAFAPFTSGAITMTNAGPTYNALYYPFEFRPSGVVTPNQVMTNFCFAVLPARDATLSSLTNAASVVKNYAIIQVNPVTGTPSVFRP